MTVRARPSANRTLGWPAALPAALSAALLCTVMITGCSGGGAPTAVSGSRDPGKSASPRACSQWAGLDDLFNVTTWMRQLIGDEVIFGPTTSMAKRDGLAVVVYAESLDGLWENLPPQYARDLRDSVLPVATSPYKETPEQLNTAANDAQSLAVKISTLCL